MWLRHFCWPVFPPLLEILMPFFPGGGCCSARRGRGCSQRYPHPGYAQNYALNGRMAGAQPVDRNGESRPGWRWLRTVQASSALGRRGHDLPIVDFT